MLYFKVLRAQDRIAVKPHASPAFHAIQYLFGLQTREKLEDFRAIGGAQSYPSRTKDTDAVDFSTGSVGLGVAQTLFSSLVQDYVRAHGWMKDKPEGRYIAIVGDAEMDEGNIYEALVDGWKQDVRNLWWIVDYNRQIARRRGARRPVGEVRKHVPQFRVGRGDREVRQADERRVRRAGRAAFCGNGSTRAPTSSMRRCAFRAAAPFARS